MARETRLHRVSDQRPLGIAARPGLKAPPTSGCVLLCVLQHHGDGFTAALTKGAVGKRKVSEVVIKYLPFRIRCGAAHLQPGKADGIDLDVMQTANRIE